MLVVIGWVGEMITRTSTYSTLNSNMCASSSSYFEPASATRSGIARIKSPKWGASEPRVDTRAWALLICRADRPNLGWRWVVGWVMVDARTKKRVGELAGRRHTNRSESYLCAVPTTGWRGVRLRR